MIKKIVFLLCILITVFMFDACSYGNLMYESVEPNIDEESISGSLFEKILPENKLINLMSSSTELLDDVINMKSVYTDDNNNVRAMFFEYTGSNYSDSMGVNINGAEFEISETPDSSGYVYIYFDEGDVVLSSQSVEISFFNSNDESESIAAIPVNIVESDKDWEVSDDGHTLYFYDGSETDVTVPNFYNGVIVTDVGGYADTEYHSILEGSSQVSSISSIDISEGIINIGNYMCYGITDLSQVSLPESCEIIGGFAFAYTSLTGSIAIPENTREIYAGAFANTNITGVELNSGIERICSYAFYNCASLSGELILPEGLYYLGEYAFCYCSGLSGSLEIPSSLETVSAGAFWDCTGFTGDLILNEGVKIIEGLAFAADGSPTMKFTSLSLPSTLNKIGTYAFQYCTQIKEIELPEGLEIISDGAFNHMSGLENETFVIPSTVTTIGGDYNVDENTGYGGHIFYDMGKDETFTAFEVADGNEYFTAIDGVLYSKDETRMLAYPRGKRDTSFEIAEGVTQIDEMAFSKAKYLEKVILPDSYVIGDTLPDNILNQQANTLSAALYVNTAVNEIAVKDTNTNYTTKDGILYSKKMTCLYYIPNMYEGVVEIPEGVRKIEKGCMFAYNKANTKWESISIPSSIVYIDVYPVAFINAYFVGYFTMEDNIYYFINSEGKIEEADFEYGDVNMDGSIDDVDSALILKFISGILDDSVLFNEKAANVNMDSYVDLIDAILNLQ